jgi:hypothetical protein
VKSSPRIALALTSIVLIASACSSAASSTPKTASTTPTAATTLKDPTTTKAPTATQQGSPGAGAQAIADAVRDRTLVPIMCPVMAMGELAAYLPAEMRFSDDMRTAPHDSGSVLLTGGDFPGNLITCKMRADRQTVEEVRLAAVPGDGLDALEYLKMEVFTMNDEVSNSVKEEADAFGGTVGSACWTNTSPVCAAWWQGPDLFVGVALTSYDAVEREDAVKTLTALLPPFLAALVDAG